MPLQATKRARVEAETLNSETDPLHNGSATAPNGASAMGNSVASARGVTVLAPTAFMGNSVALPQDGGVKPLGSGTLDAFGSAGGIIQANPYLVAVAAIQGVWIATGGPSGFLGAPVNPNSDADALPDGVGFFRAFQGGSVYWSPQTGVHEVHGAIREKWASMGWERSLLGYPVTDETGTPDGVGRYNHFQGGSIYWTPRTGAHEVHGAIRDEWASMGWERSLLGYPVTDETGTPDGVGRYNHFQGGSIYWTPETGAHEVHGAIRDKWASMGWETSYLGYPTSDEYDSPPGRRSDFQNGDIFWSAPTGARDNPQTVMVDAPSITFGTGIAVGGNATLTLASNGAVTFRGHLHDSGFPSYDFLAVFTFKDSRGYAHVATQNGRLHGTDESGSRDSDWDQTVSNDLVRASWPLLRQGSWGWKVDVTSDWSPQKIAEDVVSVVGVVLGVIPLLLNKEG